MNDIFNLQLAVFVLRSVTGLLFLSQGYDRAFKIKADEIVSAFQTDVIRKILPGSLLKFTVHLSAYIELIGGIMLLVGFQRDIALYILSAEMIFVTLAFSLIQPMWDMQYFFPRFAFIITLLILPGEWDRFSIDHVLK
jgi:putative oxidoreductase